MFLNIARLPRNRKVLKIVFALRPEFYLLSSGKFAARKKSIQFYCKGGHAQRKNALIEHATRFQIYLISFFVIKSRYFGGDRDI